MERSQRIRVAWRKTPLRPRRYLVALALGALLHGLALTYGAALLPGLELTLVTYSPAILACFVVPAGWIVRWFLRGKVVSARGLDVPIVALLATLAGAWVACTLMVIFSALFMLFSAEWEMGALLLPMCWLLGGIMAAWGGPGFFVLAFPLTLLSVLALRAAAGGNA